MEQSIVFTRPFLMALLVSAFSVILCTISLGKMQPRVVFCDVGQGDGAYIRLRNHTDILIDTGPANNKILACLGKHMPFYDRTIEYVILTHPQSDHEGSFPELKKRYTIKRVFAIYTHTSIQTNTQVPLRGQRLILPGASLRFLSPAPSRLRLPKGDTNDLAILTELISKNTRVIFTADASSTLLNSLTLASFNGYTVLKIPHHGSAKSISTRFLRLAHPALTVISVGKGNPHGHPSTKLLDLLKALSIPVRRTDLEGDIVIPL
jgi:competence protein ComEC